MSDPTVQETVQTVQAGDPRYGQIWYEIAQDQQELWHWCLWSSNGRPVARSGVAYQRKKDAVEAVRKLRSTVDAATRIIYCRPKESEK
jgi:uncharacterized protein YegP (UPF0339 family)